MRWSGVLFLVVAVTAAVAAPEDDASHKPIIEALRTLNDAYLKKDVEAIKRLTGDDLVVVTSSGHRETREEQLKSLGDLKLTEYRTDAVRVTMPSKDVAIVMFQSSVTGSFKGKPLPARMAVVTVWVNRGGKWLEVFYQGTPLEAK
jgi:ketosteroid isomerase-like protein